MQVAEQEAPHHSIESEQVILGSVMLQNDLFYSLSGKIDAEHFYDPVHRRIWEAISERLQQDSLASPITLAQDFIDDESIAALGGAKYFVNCAAVAQSGALLPGYAKEIVRASQRRELSKALSAAQESLKRADGVDMAKAQIEQALVRMPSVDGKPNVVSFLSSLTSALDQINQAYMGSAVSLKTGLRAIDGGTGGLWPSDLVIIGGRPSMGKTALATSIAKRVAERGKKVLIASLEMHEDALTQRIVSEASGVQYSKLRQGGITEADLRNAVDHAKNMQSMPIMFTPPHVQDVVSLQAAAKTVRANLEGLDLIIVDYLQLLQGRGRTRYEQMTDVSRSLKMMARTLNVPIIALAQLSRAVEQREDKRPQLADLRESGQIEQDADAVMFCYRAEYYLAREEPPEGINEQADYYDALSRAKNKMELIVQKQRMGKIFTAQLGCDVATNRFWDVGIGGEE